MELFAVADRSGSSNTKGMTRGLGLLAIPAAAAALGLAAPAGADGERLSRVTDANYDFECEGTRTRLHYREIRREPGEVAGEIRRTASVSLIRLDVAGRRIAHADLERAREAFAYFAWIEMSRVRCNAAEVILVISGMPVEAWARSIEGDGSQRPAVEYRYIRIAPDGTMMVHE